MILSRNNKHHTLFVLPQHREPIDFDECFKESSDGKCDQEEETKIEKFLGA